MPPATGSRPRFMRRAGLRCAVAGTWAAAALTGFGPARVAAASRKIVLRLVPWTSGNATTSAALLYEVTAPFRAANPGVDIQMEPSLAGSTAATLSAIVGGTPPDVIQDWDAGLWEYLNSGLVLPLDTYIRRDNLDLSVFDKGQLDAYRDAAGQLIALPAQTDPTAVAINLDLLDDLGITYPDDNWTYKDAVKLYEQTSGALKGGQARFGGEIYQSSAAIPDNFYLVGFGGGYVDPSDLTKCTADSAGSVAALQWCADMLREKLCTWRGGGDLIGAGTLVATLTDGSWTIPGYAAEWRSTKWRYYPMPAWPVRPAAFCTTNFWAIPANVKHPDLAWALLKWVATAPQWQTGMMKLFLTPPSVQTLWPQWERTVLGVAPTLADKNIGAFQSAVVTGAAYPTGPFAYASTEAYGILTQWWNKVVARTASVQEAMAQATKQVNALEQEQKGIRQGTGGLLSTFASYKKVKPGSSYAAPRRAGAGKAATPGTTLVKQAAGTYTLTGGGYDIWSTSDNCTFAGMPWTSPSGTFTCRVTGLSNVDCPYISPWAKFGLMARGDLSDDAADVTIEASGYNGVATQLRFTPDVQPSATTQGDAGQATGLLGQALVTTNNQAKSSNYMKQPVWLRMTRDNVTWSFYTSLDGAKWTAAGAPVQADMGGCWVGIFADAGNFQFNGKGRVRVTFDQLSFKPTTFVQIGVPETA